MEGCECHRAGLSFFAVMLKLHSHCIYWGGGGKVDEGAEFRASKSGNGGSWGEREVGKQDDCCTADWEGPHVPAYSACRAWGRQHPKELSHISADFPTALQLRAARRSLSHGVRPPLVASGHLWVALGASVSPPTSSALLCQEPPCLGNLYPWRELTPTLTLLYHCHMLGQGLPLLRTHQCWPSNTVLAGIWGLQALDNLSGSLSPHFT